MNIVFWIIMLFLAVALWFSLCFLFRGVGKHMKRYYEDVKEAINDENTKNKKER